MTISSPGIQTGAFRDNRSARNGCHGMCLEHRWASPGKSRQVCWQPAILESRHLAAELGKSRQVYANLCKWAGNQ